MATNPFQRKDAKFLRTEANKWLNYKDVFICIPLQSVAVKHAKTKNKTNELLTELQNTPLTQNYTGSCRIIPPNFMTRRTQLLRK
jgi:hypothetical protein